MQIVIIVINMQVSSNSNKQHQRQQQQQQFENGIFGCGIIAIRHFTWNIYIFRVLERCVLVVNEQNGFDI